MFVLSLIFIFGISLVETAGDGALVALACHRVAHSIAIVPTGHITTLQKIVRLRKLVAMDIGYSQ